MRLLLVAAAVAAVTAVAGARPWQPGPPVVIGTARLLVGPDGLSFPPSAGVPEGAAYAVLKNTGGTVVLLAVSGAATGAGWPIGPGEELTLSLAGPVRLRCAADTAVAVLYCR